MRFQTLKDLYDHIVGTYGFRKYWISELASDLGICKKNANHLTYVMGYRRGRAATLAPFQTFGNDKRVQEIYKTI